MFGNILTDVGQNGEVSVLKYNRNNIQHLLSNEWLIKYVQVYNLHTFFVQKIVGTGFPDALHSRVIVPPLRAVNCPL